jgi:uncharacterized membrane protein required for colicin V production
MLILDLIFVGVFGLISFLGFLKGLVSQLLSFTFLIINIFFSYYLSRIVLNFFVSSSLFPVVQEYILNTFFVNNSFLKMTITLFVVVKNLTKKLLHL